MTTSNLILISMPGPLELLLILLVVLLLFGARRLPEIVRGTGEAIKEFKKSISGDKDHKKDSDSDGSKNA
jgi:sec-independent protein translocase protein TatA